jgi:hypothetical protein
MKEVHIPIKGNLKGFSSDKTTPQYSEYLNNVRPQDTLEKKIRIGKRPGQKKWGNGTQIGAAEQPVVAMCVVSSIV